jgi:hypothetical protein
MTHDSDRPSESGDQQSSTEAEGPAAERYAVQLLDAYVVDLVTSRRRLEPEEAQTPEPDTGELEISHPGAERSDDGRHFSVVWKAETRMRMGSVLVTVTCAIEGQFVSDEPLSEDGFLQFRAREAFVLLWPYLRTAVGEAGRMLGMQLPPLPTIAVGSILGAMAAAEVQDESMAPG